MGGAATDAVLDKLDHTQTPARRFLIEAFFEGADERCVAPLERLLDDVEDGNIPPAAWRRGARSFRATARSTRSVRR